MKNFIASELTSQETITVNAGTRSLNSVSTIEKIDFRDVIELLPFDKNPIAKTPVITKPSDIRLSRGIFYSC